MAFLLLPFILIIFACSGSDTNKGGAYEGDVFKDDIGSRIPKNEAVEVDSGIRGDPRLMTPEAGLSSKQRKTKSVYRGRQETIFRKMKSYNIYTEYSFPIFNLRFRGAKI